MRCSVLRAVSGSILTFVDHFQTSSIAFGSSSHSSLLPSSLFVRSRSRSRSSRSSSGGDCGRVWSRPSGRCSLSQSVVRSTSAGSGGVDKRSIESRSSPLPTRSSDQIPHYHRMMKVVQEEEEEEAEPPSSNTNTTVLLLRRPPIMRACGVCRGEGQTTSRKKRSRRSSQRRHNHEQGNSNTNNNNAAEDPATTTTILQKRTTTVPCKKCGGSGILPFDSTTTTLPTTNTTYTTNRRRNHPYIPTVQPNTHIGIIGGGIGGLALAIACQHRNIPYTLYERDRDVEERKEGYGLTMQQGGRALLALGLQSAGTTLEQPPTSGGEGGEGGGVDKSRLYGKGIHSKRHVVHKPDGTVVGEWGLRKWGRPEGKKKKKNKQNIDSKRQNVHVARQELRRLLLDHVENKEERIKWGYKLLSYTTTTTSEKEEGKEEDTNDGCLTLTFQVRDDPKNHIQHHPNTTTTTTTTTHSSSPQQQPQTTTTKTVTQTVSTLVGADGIRSAVRRTKIGDELSPLRYLGCIVVLGIAPSPSCSTLTSDGETAFQTADGTTRLYAMPFSKAGVETAGAKRYLDHEFNRCCDYASGGGAVDGATANGTNDDREEEEEEEKTRTATTTTIPNVPDGCGETMWQLSFPLTEHEAKELSAKGPNALKEEALRRCGSWHDPIPDLLMHTPKELITGYPVYDRDILPDHVFRTGSVVVVPEEQEEEQDNKESVTTTDDTKTTELPEEEEEGEVDSAPTSSQGKNSCGDRVTLIGDAAHPMSPFKGQGANQALIDAVALARAIFAVERIVPMTNNNNNNHHTNNAMKIENALAEFESDMLRRSAAKVKASADAAKFLHSERAIMEGNHPRGSGYEE